MKRYMILTTLLFLTACATYRPMVDPQGKSKAQYEYDLRECQCYAEQISPEANALIGAGVGAGVGAALGAIVGAFFGFAGDGAAMGAAVGGFGGLTQGAGDGMRTQIDIIRRCMQGRGWSVLN